MFLQVDFGLVRNASGGLEPKAVELQAFPSVYGYQSLLAYQYMESYGLPDNLGIYLSDLTVTRNSFEHLTFEEGERGLR